MDTVIPPSLRPVVSILGDLEIEIGSSDPTVTPLLALVGRTPERRMMIRFTPTPEQRAAIASGFDIYLSLLTYGNPLPPLMLFTCEYLDEASVVEVMELIPGIGV